MFYAYNVLKLKFSKTLLHECWNNIFDRLLSWIYTVISTNNALLLAIARSGNLGWSHSHWLAEFDCP